MHKIYYILIFSLLFSCGEEVAKESNVQTETEALNEIKETEQSEIPSEPVATPDQSNSSPELTFSDYFPEDPLVSDSLIVEFDGLTLLFPNFSAYPVPKHSYGDSIEIHLKLSSNLNRQAFMVHTPDVETMEAIRIEEQFKICMVISDEGPHLDLIDWKNYTSDFKQVDKLNDSIYVFTPISEQEFGKFPDYTKEEVFEAAHYYGAERWSKIITDPPFGKWEDHIELGECLRTLNISYQVEGNWKEKTLVFHVPMGC